MNPRVAAYKEGARAYLERTPGVISSEDMILAGLENVRAYDEAQDKGHTEYLKAEYLHVGMEQAPEGSLLQSHKDDAIVYYKGRYGLWYPQFGPVDDRIIGYAPARFPAKDYSLVFVEATGE